MSKSINKHQNKRKENKKSSRRVGKNKHKGNKRQKYVGGVMFTPLNI